MIVKKMIIYTSVILVVLTALAIYFLSLRPDIDSLNAPTEYCNNANFTLQIINKSILIISNIGNEKIDGFEIVEPSTKFTEIFDATMPGEDVEYHVSGKKVLIRPKFNAGKDGYLACNGLVWLKEIDYGS